MIVKRLQGKKIPFSVSAEPMTVLSIPSHNILVIGNYYAGRGEDYYQIYALDNFKWIASFGRSGADHKELLGAADLQYFPERNLLACFDVNRQKFFLFFLEAILKKDTAKIFQGYLGTDKNEELIARPYGYRFFRPKVLRGSEKIIDFNKSLSPEDTNWLCWVDFRGNPIRSFGGIPPTNMPLPVLQEKLLGYINISEDGNKILVHSPLINLLELYDAKGKLLFRRKGPPWGQMQNPIDTGWNPSRGFSYLTRSATIYKESVYIRHVDPPPLQGEPGITNIYKFNTQLAPLEKWILDTGCLYVYVDAIAQKIFVINKQKEVCVYDFPLSY